MINISAIDHIVLRTTKLDEMLHFYCTILGCSVEQTQEEFRLTQIRVGDNLIDILEVDEPIDLSGQNMAHFCLRVKNFDFEAFVKYFTEHNIETKDYGFRYGSKGMGHSFYVDDPEGNGVEFCEGT